MVYPVFGFAVRPCARPRRLLEVSLTVMQHGREIRVCSGRSTERNVAAALGNRSSSTEKLLQLFDKRAKMPE